MENIIKNRLQQLRNEMTNKGIAAWYMSGSDPHQSEYMPNHWQIREFISGFNGSMGFMVVTLNDAALWTDSRYFLQAVSQLEGTGIQLMKFRIEGTPSPAQWISSQLTSNQLAGTDASCISISAYESLQSELSGYDIKLTDCGDLLNSFWTDRPELPSNPIFEHAVDYAGHSRIQKIDQIRYHLDEKKADFIILTALDDIAWTFNLRGNDVDFNPVFIAFALISKSTCELYVNQQKIPDSLKDKLQNEEINILPYEQIYSDINNIQGKLLIDPDRVNYALKNALSKEVKIEYTLSIAAILKAIKSDHEIKMFEIAMQKDGVAMVRFLNWLYQSAGVENITEYDVLLKLEEFRSEQENFMGASFHSIVGYNGNGAIVHRSVTPETAASITNDGILLFDSGGQYLEGTTDITRTVCLGDPTDLAKEDFTITLKGTIGLAELKFPANTLGCNLDLAARHAMWQTARNYGHGTAHGIGFFLNVHEGPMSIRQEYNNRVIEPGMVMSDEPAFYREGLYGIRTENVMVCKEWMTNEYGRFLQFETLTLCPIDTKLIEKSLLTETEIRWINNYHQQCFEKLAPALNDEERELLKELTQKI
nr:aminopeptidase P family protein [uncultured Carboxylicivirga sp.]